MIHVAPESPLSADATALLDALSDTLADMTGASGRASFDLADVTHERSLFVLARDETGQALGCGALRPHEPGVCEIKRMFARPDSKGVGTAILKHLEGAALAMGYREAVVETRVVNDNAVRFYRAHGYRQIANYGRYAGRPEAICLGKTLA